MEQEHNITSRVGNIEVSETTILRMEHPSFLRRWEPNALQVVLFIIAAGCLIVGALAAFDYEKNSTAIHLALFVSLSFFFAGLVGFMRVPSIKRALWFARISDVCDRFVSWVAWRLPRRLAMWTFVRVSVNGTQGAWANQNVPELTVSDALQRWDRKGRDYSKMDLGVCLRDSAARAKRRGDADTYNDCMRAQAILREHEVEFAHLDALLERRMMLDGQPTRVAKVKVALRALEACRCSKPSD